ncbi:fumarylacetoacetate hydrolase family protein [Providencia heimbachae]|uniref:5-carboxymethyl-2-oxo-hex-3-ene-1,7-dioate decarboxylase/2-hydroxyhepta-2,4-diene-1,7-dioate isomerase n=1 Tax=Providencia heimbachae ATCC 35613 TaxID=1354272 RepID=A0A1B7JPB5_9GAMM|nr:fumarylacetoacetate hydrolase family protein [Providencia heimbachae]OAT49758.1 5-carboxymethyl-2-oxo-hex-3-ene-1,7-dioate decarboxylase/2-hydroxyhepta-2,4-diene-1,7-dioate isomerase [Providencia heimbachae ATCC 35613]SQH12148.1 Homoprotocatechuate catabolism bifunctional isomerase/decarboxylase [Providencia heimbachae]
MKGTVFAVALNHQSQLNHWLEAFQQAPYKTPPKTPVWFIKPRNTRIKSGEPILHPANEEVQSGATLAIVIGKEARKVSKEKAADFIAGFALANEVSLPEDTFYRPAIKSKCRDSFCPIGEMVKTSLSTPVEIMTLINGKEADRWSTKDLIRDASELVAALSDFATLKEGDVILIGTPQQRVTIKPGDEVVIQAEGFPSLKNTVVAAGGQ